LPTRILEIRKPKRDRVGVIDEGADNASCPPVAVLRGHYDGDQELSDGDGQIVVCIAAVRSQCGAVIFSKAERPFALIELDPAHHASATAPPPASKPLLSEPM
jgi:hypothetical protein